MRIDNGFMIVLVVILLFAAIGRLVFKKVGGEMVTTEIVTSENDPVLAAEAERRTQVVNQIINQASYYWAIPEEELEKQPSVQAATTFNDKTYITVAYNNFCLGLYINWRFNIIKADASVIINSEVVFRKTRWFTCGRTLNTKSWSKLLIAMFNAENPLTQDDIYHLPRAMEELLKQKGNIDTLEPFFDAYLALMERLAKHPHDRALRSMYYSISRYIMQYHGKEFRDYLGVEEKSEDKE